MPTFVIKVKQPRWYKSGWPRFLKQPDIPGDCLKDLNVQQTNLSVWHVEDNKSNLQRILTALAALNTSAEHLDYLLFDVATVANLGITAKKTNGDTPDHLANLSWHYDLVDLSGQKVLDLAHAIFWVCETSRIQKLTIAKWLKEAFEKKECDPVRNEKLAAKVLVGPLPVTLRFSRMFREIFNAIKDAWQKSRD